MGGDWDRHELNELLEKARQGHTEDDRIAEQIFSYLIECQRSAMNMIPPLVAGGHCGKL